MSKAKKPCPNCGAKDHGGLYVSGTGVTHCGCYHDAESLVRVGRTVFSDELVVESVLNLRTRLKSEEERARDLIERVRPILLKLEKHLAAKPRLAGEDYMLSIDPFDDLAEHAHNLLGVAVRIDILRRLLNEAGNSR